MYVKLQGAERGVAAGGNHARFCWSAYVRYCTTGRFVLLLHFRFCVFFRCVVYVSLGIPYVLTAVCACSCRTLLLLCY